MSLPTVGVFALQGDVREHVRVLRGLGVAALTVRRTSELDACDGLVVPGGESTTMAKLARTFDLFEPIRQRIKEGMPVFGTCAGMIVLADRILDGAPGQETLGGLDVTVRRNAFGRQVASFESDLPVTGLDEPVRAVFIRAPWVEAVGPGVEVLAEVDGRPVLAREGRFLVAAFHPELTDDTRLHELFLESVREGRLVGA